MGLKTKNLTFKNELLLTETCCTHVDNAKYQHVLIKTLVWTESKQLTVLSCLGCRLDKAL